jgi:uncharacterized protein YjbI with pentapeptide repeats
MTLVHIPWGVRLIMEQADLEQADLEQADLEQAAYGTG